MKKLLQILISLLIPFASYAQQIEVDGMIFDPNYDENWQEDGTCTLTKYDGEASVVTIPETINFENKVYTVTKLQSAFASNKKVEEVILPPTINEIGYGTFNDCENLEKINLPEGLFKIGNFAFMNSAIENINLPSTLQELGSRAFRDCKRLISISLPKSIKRIENATFQHCSSLQEVILNEGLEEIGESAFGATAFEKLLLPNTLKNIDGSAFLNSNLQEISIPGSVVLIDENAFDSSKLKYICFEDGNQELNIHRHAFWNQKLKQLEINRKLVVCEDGWNESGYNGENIQIESLIIGYGVTDIQWINPKQYSLKQIVCNASTPPTIGQFTTAQYNNVKVFIPKGAKANYENDANWAFFQALVELEYPLEEYEIYAEPTEVTMNTGDQFTFTIKVTPDIDSYIDKAIAYNDPVIYSSPATDSPTIFTGNSSTIWGSQPGESHVTFRLLLNNKTTTCHVTVIQPATSIILNKKDLALQKGETSTLLANVSPTDVTDSTVIWSTTDAAVATVENGLVMAVGGGECDIVASTHNGLEAKCHVTVSANPESITFETPEISVLIGDKMTLTPILSPEDVTEKALTWASSDLNVATVEDGVVSCVGLGEAAITATTVNNLTAECKVIVNPILAENITLDKTEVEVPIGETFTLAATVSPDNTTDKTVTWASSDPEIATVEDGVVTCVGVGEATITATTTNGLTANCTVKVQMILVESIEIDPSEVVVEHGEQVQLTAIVLPENATNKKVEWYSDNEFVARVDENGLVTIISKKTTTIHAKATDGSGVEGTCEVTGIAGVESLLIDGKQWNVFTPDGVLIRQNVTIEDIRQLAPAIYIISDGTRTLKLVR